MFIEEASKEELKKLDFYMKPETMKGELRPIFQDGKSKGVAILAENFPPPTLLLSPPSDNFCARYRARNYFPL
jgi:hypothetical protein